MIRDPIMMLLPPSAKVPRRPRTNNRRPAAVNHEPEPDHYADPKMVEAAYTLMLLSGNRDGLPKSYTEPVNTRDKGKGIAEEEYDYDRHYHEHDKLPSSRSAKGKRYAEDDDDDDDDARRKKKMKWVAEDEDHENHKPSSSRNADRKRFFDDDEDDDYDYAREYEEMEMIAEDDDDDDEDYNNKPSPSRNAAKVVKKARTSNKRHTRPVINDGPEPPPTLSEEFLRAINAMAQGRAITQEPMLVIEKKICPTDLNHTHNRLAIPHNQVANPNFLSERESRRLLEREAKLTKDGRPFKHTAPCSLEVKVIVPSLECVTMNLRRWEMNRSFIYALTNKWTDIARKNGISDDTVIQVWAFRVDGEENVCFVIGIKNQ